jgi:hypothetical protein
VAADHATLRRISDVWTIGYHGRTLYLSDGRGVQLLALLLERPGTEMHSLDLVAGVDGVSARDRESGSHGERARVNVTRAIRSTLKRIAGYDAQLGRELELSVRTGAFCAYEPDPHYPLGWIIER